MKLARVEHWRCDEPVGWKDSSGSTYVWVPDDMTADSFENLCDDARTAYLAAEDEVKKLAPVRSPGYVGTIQGYADTATVAEVKAAHEASVAAWKVYEDKRITARRPFSWHLQQASGWTIKLFWEVKPELDYELSWGHRHGDTLDYGATVIGDYPPSKDEDGI
jgi:hypothetical protein